MGAPDLGAPINRYSLLVTQSHSQLFENEIY